MGRIHAIVQQSQPFGHQGLVLWGTMFPWIGVVGGVWFGDASHKEHVT